MLVLSRQINESIIIDGIIKITVVEVRGDKVKLGIDAPKNVSVHREEIQNIINKENRNAKRPREDRDSSSDWPESRPGN